ncbi:uncharacterized protein N0V89_003416 [Didymosphaeria variabile]|uniref:Uncharacterized protein n=1 Tax=Didymosphaeria variabile TaxID=1932322 RepID=A0A9W8XQG9_9PLEO|nr:uncharacterized protein N0V89_003416 [Didymosphaeria variabile]KAJ4355400.1 hypothetical protein N0V89_003416 [Didymosphaeria variabile]
MQQNKNTTTPSSHDKKGGTVPVGHASSPSGYTQLDRNQTNRLNTHFHSAGAATSNGSYPPMMQRWLGESIAEQPYNNIGKVGVGTSERKGA